MLTRTLLTSLLALAWAACPRQTGSPDSGLGTNRLQLTLPAPSGPYEIGTASLHLVDNTRQDPWWSTPHPRELMISIWYPAEPGRGGKPAPWMTPTLLAQYRSDLIALLSASEMPRFNFDGGGGPGNVGPGPGGPDGGAEPSAGDGGMGGGPGSMGDGRMEGGPGSMGDGRMEGTPPPPPTPLEISLENVEFPVTHARQNAPVRRAGGRYPIVIYSPGYPANRETGTMLVEDLASRGYVVVTIGFTYDAPAVEFPGERLEKARPNLDNDGLYSIVKVRTDDTRFVLEALASVAAGVNPDAENRPLPMGLRESLDLTKIGMFGHSLGGATTAQSMANDDRIGAGIDLDGHVIPTVSINDRTDAEMTELLGEIARKIGNRPILIMTSNGKGPNQLGGLMTKFWYQLVGWRRFISLAGSTHGSYTDELVLFDQLAAGGAIKEAGGGAVPSTRWSAIATERAIAVERAYIAAFFDLWLRDRESPLLEGPSEQYPEIEFH